MGSKSSNDIQTTKIIEQHKLGLGPQTRPRGSKTNVFKNDKANVDDVTILEEEKTFEISGVENLNDIIDPSQIRMQGPLSGRDREDGLLTD